MTKLHHIRIPSIAPHFPTYAEAAKLQTQLQQRLHEYKSSLSSPSSLAITAPPPSLISFTPAPTYTLGRRQVGPLSTSEEQRLRAPLRVRYQQQQGGSRWEHKSFEPEVVNAPRGGLATYHGPGQVVFWPVIDLHSPWHRHLTVRDYACLLEKTTIAALARVTRDFGTIAGFTTNNPGVWVRHSTAGISNTALSSSSSPSHEGGGSEERKIAALGVHLRRHVTGLGVAVNVSMPVIGPEETNPWSRIVACGLEDKGVTSIMTELHGVGRSEDTAYSVAGVELHDALCEAWAHEFEERLAMKFPGQDKVPS